MESKLLYTNEYSPSKDGVFSSNSLITFTATVPTEEDNTLSIDFDYVLGADLQAGFIVRVFDNGIAILLSKTGVTYRQPIKPLCDDLVFANPVKLLREEFGVNAKFMAEAWGVSVQYVYMVIKNDRAIAKKDWSIVLDKKYTNDGKTLRQYMESVNPELTEKLIDSLNMCERKLVFPDTLERNVIVDTLETILTNATDRDLRKLHGAISMVVKSMMG